MTKEIERLIIRSFDMAKVNLAIVFYSMGGSNYQMAKWAAEAAKEAGAEVKLLKVAELAPQSAIEENPAWKATEIGRAHV